MDVKAVLKSLMDEDGAEKRAQETRHLLDESESRDSDALADLVDQLPYDEDEDKPNDDDGARDRNPFTVRGRARPPRK